MKNIFLYHNEIGWVNCILTTTLSHVTEILTAEGNKLPRSDKSYSQLETLALNTLKSKESNEKLEMLLVNHWRVS